jgi:pimeloyl-ACP methyl ester carboxylesterase
VADLEAVRRALGSPKLDLVGVSYGTRVAQHYAAAHPEAVRSIVLDGVVPNQMVLGATFAEALQHSLQLQAAACTETPACNKAFGNWYQTLHRLYAKLRRQPPQPVTFKDPFTYQPVTRRLNARTLARLARLFSYTAATQALLPLAIEQAVKGDYAPLLGQSQLMTADVNGSLQGAMQFSVICTEDAPLLKPRPKDAGTLLGNQIVHTFTAVCKQWPHGPMPKGFHAAFRSSIPTLLISGQRDPVTPPADASEVLKGLSDGRSLVVRGRGHAESINAGCMPRLLRQFVNQLDPKRLAVQCLKKLGPIPAFISFNGAAP